MQFATTYLFITALERRCSMDFKINKENSLGYKELTDADLGRSATSHQTHIALFQDVLTFLDNHVDIDDSFLIYNRSYKVLPTYFDRIENPDGSFRSPKIKTGNSRDGVVFEIRNIAKRMRETVKWYLFWFGLDDERPVFFLFNNQSSTYDDIVGMGLELPDKVKQTISSSNPLFKKVIEYVIKDVNLATEDFWSELESQLEIDPSNTTKHYRRYDIEKAKASMSAIGKAGEQLINEYLSSLLNESKIAKYNWENERSESGLPYDFSYETLDGKKVYLDVKTTGHKFNQKMIFSSQEVEFVANNRDEYLIYRVYRDENGAYYLKTCSNSKSMFEKLKKETLDYIKSVSPMATIGGIKMAISPTQKELTFSEAIILNSLKPVQVNC